MLVDQVKIEQLLPSDFGGVEQNDYGYYDKQQPLAYYPDFWRFNRASIKRGINKNQAPKPFRMNHILRLRKRRNDYRQKWPKIEQDKDALKYFSPQILYLLV